MSQDMAPSSEMGQLKPQSVGGKKRKVAVFLGYLGEGYQGMQRNPGQKTIEADLEAAMTKAGCISADNAGSFSKISWSRAARTDKGVSALGQVVGANLMLLPEQPSLVERVNQHLPDSIRLFGYFRTTNGFDARKFCDKREYEYVLPAWALDPTVGLTLDEYARLYHSAQATKTPTPEGELAHSKQTLGPGPSNMPLEAGPLEATREREGVLDQDVRDNGGPSDGGQANPVKQTEEEPVGEARGAAVGSELPGGLDVLKASEVLSDIPAPCASSQEDRSPLKTLEGAPPGSIGPPGSDKKGVPQALACVPDLVCSNRGQPTEGAETVAMQSSPGRQGLATPSPAACQDPQDRLRAEIAASTYQFTEEERQRLSRLLSNYVGTHNFHNFTVRVSGSDPQSMRYIHSFECPGTITIGGQPWVKMVVVGQSFMLHQIRKMVGLVIAIMRGEAPGGCLDIALRSDWDVNVPMAPELGLLLDRCFFDSYSKKWAHQLPEPIDGGKFLEAMEQFKHQAVYPHMARRDMDELVNGSWLRTCKEGLYRFSTWEARGPTTRPMKANASQKRPQEGVGSEQQAQRRRLEEDALGEDKDGSGVEVDVE